MAANPTGDRTGPTIQQEITDTVRKAQPLILKGTEPTTVVETCEKDSEENAR